LPDRATPFTTLTVSSRLVNRSATMTNAPSGVNAMPKGCEARGSAMVLTTALVAGSTTLTELPRLLVTQINPFEATAMARGAVPTVISATLVNVMVSKALTLSLSWLTTHSLGFPITGVWTTMLLEALGWFAVVGR